MTKNHEPPDQNAVLRVLRQDLEAENERLREENKWLRELLQEAVAGHKSSWEWEDERMKWVEVQIDKDVLREIEQALEGGGTDGSA